MRTWPRLSTLALAPALALLLGSRPVPLAQTVPTPQRRALPRTEWGDPDFQGIWNYATMTPLERPREFAGQAVLSESEAVAYERRILGRQTQTNNTAGPDWWDPGTRQLVERRT